VVAEIGVSTVIRSHEDRRVVRIVRRVERVRKGSDDGIGALKRFEVRGVVTAMPKLVRVTEANVKQSRFCESKVRKRDRGRVRVGPIVVVTRVGICRCASGDKGVEGGRYVPLGPTASDSDENAR
jgi:hypothetical protein